VTLLKSRANAEIEVIKTTKYADRTLNIAAEKLLPALLDEHLNKVII
jgi:hypothetical protein